MEEIRVLPRLPRRNAMLTRSQSYAPLRRPIPPAPPPRIKKRMREEGLWSRLFTGSEAEMPPGHGIEPCALVATRFRGSIAPPRSHSLRLPNEGGLELSQRSIGRLVDHHNKEASPAPSLSESGMWSSVWEAPRPSIHPPIHPSSTHPPPLSSADLARTLPQLQGSPTRRRRDFGPDPSHRLSEPVQPRLLREGRLSREESQQRRASLLASLAEPVEAFARSGQRSSMVVQDPRRRPIALEPKVRFAGHPLSPSTAHLRQPQSWIAKLLPTKPQATNAEDLPPNLKRSLTVGSLMEPGPRRPVRPTRSPEMNRPIYSVRQVLQSPLGCGMLSERAGEWVTPEEAEELAKRGEPRMNIAYFPTYVQPLRCWTLAHVLPYFQVGESYYATEGGEGGGPLAECRNPVITSFQAPEPADQDAAALDPLDLPARLMRGRAEERAAAMRRSRSQPMHNQVLNTTQLPTPAGSDMDSGWHSGSSSGSRAKGEEEGRLSFYSTTSAATSDSNSSHDHRDDSSWGSGGGSGVLGEAIWDHVTLAPDELPLKAGDVVTILDWSSHPDLWFGTASDDRSGWFPASHVRLLAAQSGDSGLGSPSSKSVESEGGLRSSVLRELLTTERDYVSLLRDVVEGFLRQAERRVEMFSSERLVMIFGNLEEIFALHRRFLADLEEACSRPDPAVAQCFLRHERSFEIYSDYCNNQPLSCSELGKLYSDAGYRHFFEACRLLRGLPALSLDAFLLSPVQRICKYPLQLAELAKHTPPSHVDYAPVQQALGAMKAVARVINERKRRLEHLQSIAAWERGVEGWVGPSLLDSNSHLVHSGDLTLRFILPNATSVAWTKDLLAFLFNNTLVLCKKDMLKRQQLIFKDQIHLDGARWHFLSDGKDTELGVSVKNGWRLEVPGRGAWLGTCRSREGRRGWEKAVRDLPPALPPPTLHDKRIALANVNANPAPRTKKTSSTDIPNSKSVPGKMWNRLKAA